MLSEQHSHNSSDAATRERRSKCLHCGLDVPEKRRAQSDQLVADFCCNGCSLVYQTLQGLGLGRFYALRDDDDLPQRPAEVPSGPSRYSYFNDPTFADRYISHLPNGNSQVRWVVEGIHCSACIWLLEKLPEIAPGVQDARVHFGSNVLELSFDETKTHPAELAQQLEKFGYRVFPCDADAQIGERRKAERLSLLRIGVAAVSAGNTMMLSVSLYQGIFSGIEQKYASYFGWLSALLALPVLLFSAQPFYRGALAGLRVGVAHIDLPISIGIVGGFFASIAMLALGRADVYFDSLCMLTFLLLVGRWFQEKGLRRATHQDDALAQLIPFSVERVEPTTGERELVYYEQIKSGDLVRIPAGETLVADGTITQGASHIDRSVITGESRPIRVSIGDFLDAGVRNLTNDIQLKVQRPFSQTSLGKLLEELRAVDIRASKIVSITDRLSGYFVSAVLALSGITGIWAFSLYGFESALDRVLALLIVSCPCALGLSAPIALSVGMNRLRRRGILLSSVHALELLPKAKYIFFDKTGTLTHGQLAVSALWTEQTGIIEGVALECASDLEPLRYARSLEAQSRHPAAAAIRSLSKSTSDFSSIHFDDLQEVPGQGVEGFHQGHRYRVGRLSWATELVASGAANPRSDLRQTQAFEELRGRGGSLICVSLDGMAIALLSLADTVRDGMGAFLDDCRQRKCTLGILSGDDQLVVSRIGAQLGFPEGESHGGLLPEEKRMLVRAAKEKGVVVMVGDGINDALSLREADVGIALHGGAAASLRAADVYIAQNVVQGLREVFAGSDAVVRAIRRNLWLSVLYNSGGAMAAMAGWINPLVAAILMPLSSLSVILSSLSIREYSPRKRNVGWR